MKKNILQLLVIFSFSLNLGAQELNQNDSIKVLMMDKLEIGGSYEIIFQSRGCFHNYSDTLKISREYDVYYFSTGKDRLILEGEFLKKYRRFEYELLYVNHFGGCTTSDYYILKTNDEEILLLIDGSCDWDGFQNITRKEK